MTPDQIVAHFSEDRRHRYTLWRHWRRDALFIKPGGVRYVQFIGLNPSTADEVRNDPTVTRCIAFATAWGYDVMCMTNLFGLRSTHPMVMKAHPDPIGAENNFHLLTTCREAGLVVACWGNHGKHLGRNEEVLKMLEEGCFDVQVQCLGLTGKGHPKHPLYLKKTVLPVPLPPSEPV